MTVRISFAVLLAALAALGVASAATGKPDRDRPPKPNPRIDLLTTKQEGVLRKGAVKATVFSRRGREARVEAAFVVDGYPDDFHFKLGPKTERLRGNDAAFRLKLSARKREVLDFAIKSCRWAKLDIRARVGRGRDREVTHLRRPPECRPG